MKKIKAFYKVCRVIETDIHSYILIVVDLRPMPSTYDLCTLQVFNLRLMRLNEYVWPLQLYDSPQITNII